MNSSCSHHFFFPFRVSFVIQLPLNSDFFPRDVLDEIWDLIEPVSGGFPSTCSGTYFYSAAYMPILENFANANLHEMKVNEYAVRRSSRSQLLAL